MELILVDTTPVWLPTSNNRRDILKNSTCFSMDILPNYYSRLRCEHDESRLDTYIGLIKRIDVELLIYICSFEKK